MAKKDWIAEKSKIISSFYNQNNLHGRVACDDERCWLNVALICLEIDKIMAESKGLQKFKRSKRKNMQSLVAGYRQEQDAQYRHRSVENYQIYNEDGGENYHNWYNLELLARYPELRLANIFSQESEIQIPDPDSELLSEAKQMLENMEKDAKPKRTRPRSIHVDCKYSSQYSIYKHLPPKMPSYKKKKICPKCATCGTFNRNFEPSKMILREENAKIRRT
ncbi:MAG: hypothetical protein FWG80_00055 [Alphaproteobacteria bacterium]|nr:hypothetical protein [Alphaproteobacteria bacterium]